MLMSGYPSECQWHCSGSVMRRVHEDTQNKDIQNFDERNEWFLQHTSFSILFWICYGNCGFLKNRERI